MARNERRGLMRRLARALLVVVGLLVLFAAGGLSWAHLAMRGERPPLPDAAELRALADGDLPVRLSWIETASQRGTPGGDGERRTVTHSVFVVEWADGRLLLIDAGMDAAAARAFGKPMEWLLGAEPVEVGRSVAEALGPARAHLAGIAFTHLHMDHTQGMELLCPPGAPPFSVFAAPAQTERPNFGTRSGLGQVRSAACARRVSIADSGLVHLDGFPGVGIARVAGHTPGSQIIAVWVGGEEPRGYILAGDAVFEIDQVCQDRPKPLLYRLLITPENDEQLGQVRRWLRALEREHGFAIVPSHDRAHIDAVGLPQYRSER